MNPFKFHFRKKKNKAGAHEGDSLEMTREENIETQEGVGKKDACGTVIYNGDILQYARAEYPQACGVYLIKWDAEECAFVCERKTPYNFLSPNIWHECVIVGNRVENPEMMEQKLS